MSCKLCCLKCKCPDGLSQADQALSAAIQEELSYEDESAANAPAVPEFLAKFNSLGIWQVGPSLNSSISPSSFVNKVTDKLGQDEVILERTYGDEK